MHVLSCKPLPRPGGRPFLLQLPPSLPPLLPPNSLTLISQQKLEEEKLDNYFIILASPPSHQTRKCQYYLLSRILLNKDLFETQLPANGNTQSPPQRKAMDSTVWK